MSEGGDSTTTGAAPVETIDRDLPCVRCAYNLRGLPPDDNCPECGSPVGDSLIREPLRHLEPKRLRRLIVAARCVKWSWIAAMIVLAYEAALGALARPLENVIGEMAMILVPFMCLGVPVITGAAIVMWIGVFLLSEPDRRVDHPQAPPKASWRASQALSPWLLGAGFGATIIAFSADPWSMPAWFSSAALGAVFLAWHSVLLLERLRDLESRCEGVPARRLAVLVACRRYAPALIVLGPSACFLLIVLELLTGAVIIREGGRMLQAIFTLSPIVCCLPLTLLVWNTPKRLETELRAAGDA